MPSKPLPPGSFGLPFLGETLSFVLDPDFARKREAKYGDIFRSHITGRRAVVMTGPDANRFILSSHMDHFSWREGWPITFRNLFGESLFLQEGEQHRRNRKLLRPAFHGKALASYLDTMIEICDRYCHHWSQLGTFTWFPQMKQMTFEIASILLIGSQTGDLNQQLSLWMTDFTNGLFSVPINWSGLPYGKAIRARDRLLEHIEQVVHERRENPTTDALGLLVQSVDEDGDRLSLEELKVQALLMLFAGHETTTSMLTSTMMALSQHPEVMQQVLAEQAPWMDETVTLDQLKAMPYLDQVLKEVERLYPPVGGGFRGVIKPFDYKGYHVPAGWLALYQINASHRNPNCFAEAERFDPDRFSPERAEHKRTEYSLVGFGGGPRICLGVAFAQMELKVVASILLRRYQWTLLPDQDFSMNPVPTLKPRSGLKVTFAPRMATTHALVTKE